VPNYGSGVLGSWASYQNGISGTWATAQVGVIGDSISTAIKSALTAKANAEGKTIAINYWSSRPFAPNSAYPGHSMSEWLMQQSSMPPVLVIVGGSNDIFDPPAFRSAVGSFLTWMEENHPDTDIYWVDTQVRRTAQTTAVQWADQMNSGWVNQAIHDVRPMLAGVVPWSEFFCADKNRVARYLRDGLHPTDGTTSAYNGVAALVNLIWTTINPSL
jgi:hypothetical protein